VDLGTLKLYPRVPEAKKKRKKNSKKQRKKERNEGTN
jgi:hypothetical protein